MADDTVYRVAIRRADTPDTNGDIITSDALRRIADKNPTKFEWDEAAKTLYMLSHRLLVSAGGPNASSR